jgi:DNA repair protein RecN (Recombination protein N)
MLQKLFVQNFALIDSLEIDFQTGLTVITGETGAGKSILLGALALGLGARADKESLKHKDKKCIVEIEFNVEKLSLTSFFEENDLDFETQTVIRREISPNGKSRAFINDTPVNLNQVKSLGDQIIDIHSQHENLELNQHEFQFLVVDTLADNNDTLKKYQKNFAEFQSIANQINSLKDKNKEQKERFDFLKFQYNELKSTNLKADEQEELEQEQKRLSHSEEIAENLSLAVNRFNREELSIIDELSNVKNEVNRIASYFKNGNDLVDRLNSALIDLSDISQDLTEKTESIQFDPNRLDEINKRLNQIYSLQQKHNKTTISELLLLQNNIEEQLNAIESFEDDLLMLEKKQETQRELIKQEAKKLHNNRIDTAKKISEVINSQLKELGMQVAVFNIEVSNSTEFNKFGTSGINFKFASDPKSELRPITKIASGGELSRIMLVIKSLIASKKALPTLIFDEIDTGVSGEIADKMGQIMKSMSSNMQIIAITHLPQIAAKGDNHYIVYKTHNEDGAQTHLKSISGSERINVIAQMLSTDKPGEAAIANAKELLSN